MFSGRPRFSIASRIDAILAVLLHHSQIIHRISRVPTNEERRTRNDIYEKTMLHNTKLVSR